MNFCRRVFLTAGAILTVAACVSCNMYEKYDDYSNFEDTDYVKYLYSNQNQITLNGIEGKTVYYVNYNNSYDNAINVSQIRKGDSKANEGKFRALYVDKNTGFEVVPETIFEDDNSMEDLPFEHSMRCYEDEEKYGERKVSARYNCAPAVVKASDFTVDSSTKRLVVDGKNGTYRNADATLRAIGYSSDYHSDDTAVCLVWVVDDSYTTGTSSYGKVNSQVVQELADKFGEIYESEREIFGKERDFFGSDTGSLVNIVISDIDMNGTAGGVIGYFSSKDYGPVYSNNGKYFYLDTYYVNYNTSKAGTSRFGGTGHASSTAISTLVHEFQHMIYYGNKYTLKPIWYDEMLSMLAEDMMSDALGLSEDETVQAMRLPYFNAYYNRSGIDEWRKDRSDASIYSYSTAYAFGAFLTRNYGGIQLVKNMSASPYAGMKAIVEAIAKTTGKTVTTRQLYSEFIQSCTFKDDFAMDNNLSSFNKNEDSYSTSAGVNTKLSKISLFNFSNKKVNATGPVCYSQNDTFTDSLDSTLRPHGFIVTKLGVANSDSVTIKFTESTSTDEIIMIIIQD